MTDNQKLDLIMKMIEQQSVVTQQLATSLQEVKLDIRNVREEMKEGFREEKHERAKMGEKLEKTQEVMGGKLEKVESRLEKVYEARNQVTVNFSRAFATTNAVIAGVIAILVSLFVGK